MPETLSYDIHEITSPDGGLLLELNVEGERIARATASGGVLQQMHATLGLGREEVAGQLRQSLIGYLKHQLEAVQLSEPVESSDHALRFSAGYRLRQGNSVSAGIAWYDVNTSETGPEEIPAIVRNKLRTAVHRTLTGGAA